MKNIISGEEKAWETLSCMDSEEVTENACVSFDADSKIYRLESFGQIFAVDIEKRQIESITEGGGLFLTKLAYFFRLSALWYLVKAAEASPTGKLVKPSGLPGGDIFFRGSHVLPLDAVAKKYAQNKDGFIEKGLFMGGKKVNYGDSAIELYPFPRIPVTTILWLADEEWGARFDLLFDNTCIMHLPIDILWSVAMMSVLIFGER
ncbi:MAG: hypothetical protein A2X59_00215 [Nitrospirae bacterium GWC2_42_7]|nr:MAG: hypothetical protein A2X59_00215 [Nitrospirae bacterium GWC2_42_7]